VENQLELENQLKLIAISYDRGIDLGRKGISSYENFPSYITNHPSYSLLQQMDTNDSGRKEIARYLAPKAGMKFIDLGCCLNLMFCGYKDWPSAYYGVDISSKTIDLLQEFVEKNGLIIGGLYCGSMHKTPYDTNFFDIGECIGSLEYFEKDFVQRSVAEFHRIIKPNGKFVLDIPNLGSPEFEISKLVEEYLGRADKFDLPAEEFETILGSYFVIERKDKVGPMIQYFLMCKK